MNRQGKEPIAIFGAGWVGLVTGACFAELGHEVTIRDVVPEKIEQLQAGEVPFFEPDLGALLERNADRLTFTLDATDCLNSKGQSWKSGQTQQLSFFGYTGDTGQENGEQPVFFKLQP